MKEETLKAKIKERYGKIAVSGNSDCCCAPQECCNTADFNPKESLISIGYNQKDLEAIPESSLLGLGCGAPIDFANLKNPLTFIVSPFRKRRGELTAPVFTSKSLFLRSARMAHRTGELGEL